METISLSRGAKTAVETCMAVKSEESVIIVTDINKFNIAVAFMSAAHAVGADAVMTIMKPRSRHGEEPPRSVADAMKHCDVIMMPTTHSLSHTEAKIEAKKAGARIASMPGITEDMMTIGGLTADYREVAKLSSKITNLLKKTKELTITTPAGTDVKMSLEGREPPPPDDGLLLTPGRSGNLPAGESAHCPIEESASGVVVADGSMAPLGLLRHPMRLTLKKGKIIKIEGEDEAERLREFLERLEDPYAYWLGEVGIGTNDKARLTGNILEDEKAIGTVHLGFGTNVSMGGNIKSKTHNDAVLLKPTIKLDDKVIMRDGKLLI